MMPRRLRLAIVITHERGDNRAVAPFQAWNVAVQREIFPMLVMAAMAHSVANIMQQRTRFQQDARLRRQVMNRLQLVAVVNSVLAGNLASSNFAIWWRMQIFYLVVFLQRHFALCPRLSLSPKDCPPGAGERYREEEPAAAQTV